MVRLMHCDNIDVHCEASRAIANLYSSFGNHNAIIIRDGIPRLVHLAVSADLEWQCHGALAFSTLTPRFDICINASLMLVVFKRGFTLIGVNELKIQRQAATALRDVAANDLFKIQFVDGRWG